MSAPPPLPPCPTAGCCPPHVVRNGSANGRRRYRCRACGAWFGETTGTPMHRLRTPAAEVARALLCVLRRGSLRAAEEQTGHKAETIAAWLRRAAPPPPALGEAL